MQIMNVIKIAALIPVVVVSACQNTPVPIDSYSDSYIELGQEIAETQCAACHGIGSFGSSPRGDAPPLRTVLATYNPEALSDDFREHIHVGHPDMPNFDFTVKETEGLLAYLKSIQEDS